MVAIRAKVSLAVITLVRTWHSVLRLYHVLGDLIRSLEAVLTALIEAGAILSSIRVFENALGYALFDIGSFPFLFTVITICQQV